MKKELYKVVGASLVVTMLALTGFASIEPALAQAASASDAVLVTLNVDTGISITSPSDATMSTSLSISNNKAVATSTWNVKTNSVGGYTLAVSATTTPAMRMVTDTTKNIANYTETTPGTPETWSVGSNTAEFGYGAYGTDIAGAFGGDTSCSAATSTPSTTLKYVAASTTARTIASRTSTTTQSGVDTVVCYAVEQGSNFYVASGVYAAYITATATTQ